MTADNIRYISNMLNIKQELLKTDRAMAVCNRNLAIEGGDEKEVEKCRRELALAEEKVGKITGVIDDFENHRKEMRASSVIYIQSALEEQVELRRETAEESHKDEDIAEIVTASKRLKDFNEEEW